MAGWRGELRSGLRRCAAALAQPLSAPIRPAKLQEGDLLTLDGKEGAVFHALAARVQIDYAEERPARLEALRRSATVTPA